MRPQDKHLEYSYRLYLNANGQRVLGKGGAQILEAIQQRGSIVAAAKGLGMSYRFVWNYLGRMRTILGQPVVVTYRGGSRRRSGRGGASLTPLARTLLREFRSTQKLIDSAMSRQKIHVQLRPRSSVAA